ncbi:hypothetical protein ACIBSV_36160 [Embleya sp. NPDC050154]|uniref:hypothetical protein n=1 Tax=Embleya sp. NPDC050154 TaxID=3363988 RepID=UPI0037BD1220
MDRPGVHAYLELADGTGAEVTVDLYDWPDPRSPLPALWSAIVTDGPPLPEGTEGVLHPDEESPVDGHPFVVIASAGSPPQLRGREH